MDKQELGKIGEELAVNFLKKKGYQILDRNFRTSRFGEIDIVARDCSRRPRFFGLRLPYRAENNQEPIVFVEVKTKSSHIFGLPEEELTFAKKQKLRRAVQDWFWTKKVETNNWRIDLIAVDFTRNKEKPKIRHYPGCF